ncbi:glutathione S-transferase [Pseudosulfitobacter sp. DSM 107133]|jgi:glutathione S-transferase|uniref:glutathione S-transferase n=1 Tax=Pseudosulfitobacter sp. DSM 107133 TaxID=2883100 RepID=UPI000DF397B7|nr:glutathione S-transferase [Pseudosulfitobacter sp. DSM 107133]UOA25553.1 putative GST-like protein YibF [Pseudosulfitobacter sp. DSM 107133]
MKLMMSGASPFVRKVLVVLHETQQLDDVEIVTVTTAPGATPADLAAANPIGKIPALVRNEGATLYDSRVITRFLDDRAKSGLYPVTSPWETLTLEATGDAIMEAAVAMVYERRLRDEALQSDTWVENQWEKVSRALNALDSRWMGHLYGPLDIGHIAVGCALGYLDFRHEDRNWRKGHDALAAWAAKFAERDSMQATVP